MSRIIRRKQTVQKLDLKENKLQSRSSKKLSAASKNSSGVDSCEHNVMKRTTRASNNIKEQDENAISHTTGSSIHKIGNNNSVPLLQYDSKSKNTIEPVKSVLRDRTNAISDSKKSNPSEKKLIGKTRQKTTDENSELKLIPMDRNISKPDSNKENTETSNKVAEISKENQSSKNQSLEKSKFIQNSSNSEEMEVKGERVLRTRSRIMVDNEQNKVQNKQPTEKKFFKSVRPIKPTTITRKEPDKKVKKKRKEVKKNTSFDSFLSFGTAVKELSQLEKKTLRPRQALKNYCEESKFLEKISPKKRESVVILNKLPDLNAKKVPIWKSVKFLETESSSKDVYEIANDVSSEEPRSKKRKKRTARNPVKRLKKATQIIKTDKSAKPVKPGRLIKKLKTSEEILGDKALIVKPQIKQIITKPKLISSEILDDTKKINFSLKPPITVPPSEFRPFRVTQAFDRRPTILNTILDQSPIQSSIQNLHQSTQEQNKVSLDKQTFGSIESGNSMQDKPKMNRIEEDKFENIQESSNKLKISNDSIQVVEMKDSFETNKPNSSSFNDDVEDKENATPFHRSSQSSPKKSVRRGKSIFELQPGPSGLQNRLLKAKVLKQKSLNKFLNLDATPRRLDIRTSHGIFDDVHSTPITDKPLKMLYEPNIQNAFGFDDDFDVSPIISANALPVAPTLKGILKKKVNENKETNMTPMYKKPLRITKKINTLYQRRIGKEQNDNKEENLIDNKHLEKRKNENEKKNQQTDKMPKNIVTDYSDTFDFLQDQENQRVEENRSQLPLFADLEPPTHFTAVSIYFLNIR